MWQIPAMMLANQFMKSQDKSGEQAAAAAGKNAQLYQGIELPNHTWKDYAPELYNNETMNHELIEEDSALKSQQGDHLRRLMYLGENGMSDVDKAGFDQARGVGNRMAKQNTDAALANAQARGVGGSGLEFAMREMGNQAGAERARESAMMQAAESAKQRAQYQAMYGNAMAGVRGQDMQANRANTDIINQFNQANTSNRNQMNNANVDIRNQAQQTNAKGRTDTAQTNFQNQMQRAGGIATGNSGVAAQANAQNAANQSERNTLIGVGADLGMAGMNKPNSQPSTQVVGRQYSGASPYQYNLGMNWRK